MVIITCLYLALVYLLFFEFKLLPWNKISQGLTGAFFGEIELRCEIAATSLARKEGHL